MVLLALIVSVVGGLTARAWAQPYEGFGASTPGGTGGSVVHVTTLAEAGPGSFREAVSQGNRTIVFDVGGTIELTSAVFMSGAFVTIDGFSAPSPGITLHGGALVLRGNLGVHDVIVRGIRVRGTPLDGIQVANSAYNIVIDHVSVHGAGDGNIDITESSHDVTVSWSILAAPTSEKNMLIKYNPSRITLHHNIFVDSTQRNPIVSTDDAGTPATDTTVDVRNNVVANWGIGFGTMIFKGARANVVANFTSNPDNLELDQAQGVVVCDFNCNGDLTALSHAYVIDNLSADPLTGDMNAQGNVIDPFPAPAVTIQDAYTAAQNVLAQAGVRPLDAIDEQVLAGIEIPPRPDGPNLSVSFLSVATGTDSFTITDRVTNSGTQQAGSSTTRFWLSTDTIVDASDVPLASRSVGTLDPGVSNTGTIAVPFPPGITGTFFLIAQADGDGVITETSEAENTTMRTVTINGPDLIVSALAVPAGSAPGGNISVSETTRNQGTLTVGTTTTQFFLSTDPVWDGGDVPLGARSVPSLDPGTAHTKITSLTIPAGTASGPYFIIARADTSGSIAELSETNNTTAQPILIGGDLVVQWMTAPLVATPGMIIKVRDSTKNIGGQQVGATTTRYHLSVDPVLGSGDAVLGSRTVPGLPPGGVSTGSLISVTIPATTASGTYFIIVRADADNVVTEAGESNNILTQPIEIGLDLAISSFGAPAAASAGQTFSVTDTTRNAGSGGAPASTTAFYLSTLGTLDASAILIGSRPVPPLGPGVSNSSTTPVTIPSGLGGDYHLFALANADAGVAIGASGNNVKSRTLHLGPDLVVSSLTAPASAAAGATISVGDSTRNSATVGAPASTTTYYLSTTAALGDGAIPVGSRAVPPLAASTTHTGPATITIPVGTAPGSYYLIGKADGLNAVVEYSETNNTRAKGFTVLP